MHSYVHTYIKCLHILIDHGRQIFFGILSLGNGSGFSVWPFQTTTFTHTHISHSPSHKSIPFSSLFPILLFTLSIYSLSCCLLLSRIAQGPIQVSRPSEGSIRTSAVGQEAISVPCFATARACSRRSYLMTTPSFIRACWPRGERSSLFLHCHSTPLFLTFTQIPYVSYTTTEYI